MSVSTAVYEHHIHQARIASDLYVEGLAAGESAKDWREANLRARREIIALLRASVCLTDIIGALRTSAAHMRVLRALLAPPISQDQFKLLCQTYSKSRENDGRPTGEADAQILAAAFEASRDRMITPWLNQGSQPSRQSIRRLLHSVAPILSQQILSTVRRNRLATEQEGAVIALLENKGWSRLGSRLIQTLSDVPINGYMHKARFATTTLPQEVDIACGLGRTVVLAMECK